MGNMSVRGVNDAVIKRLKHQAQKNGASVNTLIVELLESSTGLRTSQQKSVAYNDLDALAGTWKAADAKAFEKFTAATTKVDAALWR